MLSMTLSTSLEHGQLMSRTSESFPRSHQSVGNHLQLQTLVRSARQSQTDEYEYACAENVTLLLEPLVLEDPTDSNSDPVLSVILAVKTIVDRRRSDVCISVLLAPDHYLILILLAGAWRTCR
jgi:hypothetical protein